MCTSSFLPQATPLFAACMNQAWDLALLLLSKGADPNKAATDKDGESQTPLYHAAKFGSIAVCKALLANRASQDLNTGLRAINIFITEPLSAYCIVGA